MKPLLSEDILSAQRDSWNNSSSSWKFWNNMLMQWLKPVGEELIGLCRLEDGMVVLDSATGTGEPGLTAAKSIPKGKVYGCDIAEKMIVVASENASGQGINNYEALVSDHGGLPFGDDYFDAVMCRFGIMFFPDMNEGLLDHQRVLKKGSRMAFSAWGVPEKNPWAALFMKVLIEKTGHIPPGPDEPGLFRCARPGLMKELFLETGMTDVEEVTLSGEVGFENPAEYWKFFSELAAPVRKVLEELTDDKVAEVSHAIMQRAEAFRKDDMICFPWEAVVVSGTK